MSGKAYLVGERPTGSIAPNISGEPGEAISFLRSQVEQCHDLTASLTNRLTSVLREMPETKQPSVASAPPSSTPLTAAIGAASRELIAIREGLELTLERLAL